MTSYIKSNFKFGDKLSSVTSLNVLSNMGVAYPDYLTTAQIITLSSQNATDTASGTGARRVHIAGVGSGYIEQDEQIWLNGTTPVSTSLNWISVDRMWIDNCGSNDTNAGNVWAGYGTVTTGLPANKLSMIMSLSGQTEKLHWTIPVSTEAHITGFNFHSDKGGGGTVLSTFKIQTRYLDQNDRSWRNRYTATVLGDALTYEGDNTSFIIDGPAYVRVLAQGTGTGALQSGIVTYELHRKLS